MDSSLPVLEVKRAISLAPSTDVEALAARAASATIEHVIRMGGADGKVPHPLSRSPALAHGCCMPARHEQDGEPGLDGKSGAPGVAGEAGVTQPDQNGSPGANGTNGRSAGNATHGSAGTLLDDARCWPAVTRPMRLVRGRWQRQ
jgi:hypothetical protein